MLNRRIKDAATDAFRDNSLLDEMSAEYKENQTIAIRDDHPKLGLKSGDTGRIWALYSTEPPAYEVTFRDADGRDFDMMLYESELMLPIAQSRSVASLTHKAG